MIARVSHLEAFRCFRNAEDWPLASFLDQIRDEQPSTPQLRVGTAFHKALERATENEYDTLTASGYTFVPGENLSSIEIPPIREIRIAKQFGNLTVSGQVDGFDGATVVDYKTTSSFTPERYLDSFKWRYYLSLTEADRFRYLIFEIHIPTEKDDDTVIYLENEPIPIRHIHQIECFRYPEMEQDCLDLAAQYERFMSQIPKEAA